jgi:trimethylamine-N-oxide reductase (cytochrome c)
MQHPWLENDMLFSDIILPSNTMFEEEDILAASWAANQTVWAGLVKQCIKPIGESMGDWDVVVEIAKKLGLEEATTGGEDVATKIRNVYQNTALKDLITWEDLNEKKYVLAPVTEGWQDLPAGQIAFYTDPEKSPLGTPAVNLSSRSTELKNFCLTTMRDRLILCG